MVGSLLYVAVYTREESVEVSSKERRGSGIKSAGCGVCGYSPPILSPSTRRVHTSITPLPTSGHPHYPAVELPHHSGNFPIMSDRSASPTNRFVPVSTHHLTSESPLSETTLGSLLERSERLADEAREALPYSFDECTYPKGYLRQGVWSCIDCGERGVCYGCSISCHAGEPSRSPRSQLMSRAQTC